MAPLRQPALTAVALPPPQFLESCDEVILLEDGEICEKGTHKELMEERGRYAKLVHNLRGLQFKVAACGDLGPGRPDRASPGWGRSLAAPTEGTGSVPRTLSTFTTRRWWRPCRRAPRTETKVRSEPSWNHASGVTWGSVDTDLSLPHPSSGSR